MNLLLFLCAVTFIPVNTTAMPCQVANFTCAGTGNLLFWEVNGIVANDLDNAGRGLVEIIEVDGQNRSNTLIVPAISINNNVAVQCFIVVVSLGSVISSPPAHLLFDEGK